MAMLNGATYSLKGVAPGIEVVGRYNFAGNSEEDLPFRKDDLLRVVAMTKVQYSIVPLGGFTRNRHS